MCGEQEVWLLRGVFFSHFHLSFGFRGEMRLVAPLLFGLFLNTHVVDSHVVIGYVGGSVTLPSLADTSWTQDKIEWAIYPNNTWIATYHGGMANTNRVPRYAGRLTLNTTSGHLTIHNLELNDAMEYSVDLTDHLGNNTVNKIILLVKQPLEEPTITQHPLFSHQSCVTALRCWSSVQDAELSWNTTSFDRETSTMKSPDGLFLFVDTTRGSREFTCTSRKGTDSASSVFRATCDDKDSKVTAEPINPPAPLHRCTKKSMLHFFGGLILGVAVTFLINYIQGHPEALRKYLKGTCCLSKTSK